MLTLLASRSKGTCRGQEGGKNSCLHGAQVQGIELKGETERGTLLQVEHSLQRKVEAAAK